MTVRTRPCFDRERVVVLDAGELRAGEAAADLEALRRRQRHDAVREVGLELVEDRLAEAGGHAAADALDDAAEGVAGAARLVDAGDHALGRAGVGAADDVRLDLRRAVTVVGSISAAIVCTCFT